MNKVDFAPHQDRALKLIDDRLIKGGFQSLLLVAGTGAGKTVIFGAQVAKLADEGKKTLILTDRSNLLTQTKESIESFYNIPVSLISAKRKKPATIDPTTRKDYMCFVAMVETLNNRLEVDEWKDVLQDIDLIIIDEAHERIFSKVINHPFFSQTKKLGVTATPIYSSTKHFMKHDYQTMEMVLSEKQGINQGFLVKPKTLYLNCDNSTASISRGEYTEDSIQELRKMFAPHDVIISKYKSVCKDFIEDIKESNKDAYNRYYIHSPYLKAMYYTNNLR